MRHGAKAAAVRLDADDVTITRVKGSNVNTYDMDGQTYKAFGAGVPDPVADLLNVGDENFQQQHDAPYWFSDTAGQVARNLNAVVDLEVMDTALASLQARARKAAARVELLQEQDRGAAARVEALEWVRAAVETWHEVEDAEEVADDLQQQADDLQQQIQKARGAERVLKRVGAMAQAAATVASKASKASTLAEAGVVLRQAMTAAQAAEQRSERVGVVCQLFGKVVTKAKAAADVQEDVAGLEAVLVAAQRAAEAAAATEHNAIEAHGAVHAVMDKGCPLCGKK